MGAFGAPMGLVLVSNSIKRIHESIGLAGADAGFLHASWKVSHNTLLSGDIEAPVM